MSKHVFIKSVTISLISELKKAMQLYDANFMVSILNSGDYSFNEYYNDPESGDSHVKSLPNIILQPPYNISIDTSILSSPYARGRYTDTDMGMSTKMRSNVNLIPMTINFDAIANITNVLECYSFIEFFIHKLFPTFTFTFIYMDYNITGVCGVNSEFTIDPLTPEGSDISNPSISLQFNVATHMPIFSMYNNSTSIPSDTLQEKFKIKHAIDNINTTDIVTNEEYD